MENNEGGGDDQGSGWLQVKKKQRSSAKLSLQRWVGGFSGKKGNSVTRNQSFPSVKSGSDKRDGELLKTGRYSAVHEPHNVGSTSHFSVEYKNIKNHDKPAIPNDECLKAPISTAENVEAPHKKVEVGQEQENNLSLPYKIKWGNLDDDINAPPEASVGTIKPISPVEDNMLTHSKAETPVSSGSSLSCLLATVSPTNAVVATEVCEKNITVEFQSVTLKENPIQDECKEVNEIFLRNTGAKIMNESVGEQDNAMASFEGQSDVCKEKNDSICLPDETIRIAESDEWVKLSDNDYANIVHDEDTACISTEDLSISQVPCVKYDSSSSKASETPLCDGELSNEVLSNDPIITSDLPGVSSPEASEVIDSVEALKHNMINDDLSESHNAEVTDAEGRSESKERFRHRLWCFLFENLNRAVDELYLLCELECDQEQVRESILVLEEAAADFKELNMRVEEFEKVKKSTSHLGGGASMTMKSDHRRSHALSWEVRRMTTSPHKAEILSSSLEAFRKIQQERVRLDSNDIDKLESDLYKHYGGDGDCVKENRQSTDTLTNFRESAAKQMRRSGNSDFSISNSSKGKRNTDYAHVSGKPKKELPRAPETDKSLSVKDKLVANNTNRNNLRTVDYLKKHAPVSEMEKERKNGNLWKSMDAWKEKRNWEDILASPHGSSGRFSHSPGISRRSTERSRILHDKLMSPDKRKKSALDLKKEAEQKHARATRIRSELDNERVQKLQRASEKLNRVNEWQAVRSMRMREVIHDRHRRSESSREAFLAQVVRRAGDESSKVNEVRFITSLNEGNKKFMLRQKLQDSELRRAEKLQLLKTKQKEDMAREEAVLERKRLLEAEKLQRLAEIQRKKEEAQQRWEEERRASTAAREAKAVEKMRLKEVRAKARQEEAELMAQKLEERLKESEQRRKFYLEQIREKASMDFRDQSSPLVRRSVNKEGGRSAPNTNSEEYQANSSMFSSCGTDSTSNVETEHALKRRIKRIRQKLMALKHEFPEPSVSSENAGIGYRTAVATARGKIGRWLQELQKLRQARKEGAASFGLISAEIMKFLDGKDAELHASRQAGLLDFIASALPASHSSKPEACQVTMHLLRMLRVGLSMPENRGYFLSQNLLPPIIPMLVASIENYIKTVASLNVPGVANLNPGKSSYVSVDVISDILDGFLWTVAVVIGHESSDDQQRKMQDGLLELVVVYKVINRLRDLFALYDRRQVEGSPFPPSILLSINLLAVLTSKSRNVSSIDWKSFASDTTTKNEDKVKPDSSADISISFKTEVKTETISDESANFPVNDDRCSITLKDGKGLNDDRFEQNNERQPGLKQPTELLLSSVAETGLVCLPSMLTAVLLQGNNKSSSEQNVLPSNFEVVATGVLKVLNNVAEIDMTFIQKMLARSDFKMEFFHVMSFILSYCTSKWESATDQNGLLLLESLSLLGYFAFFHHENQAVLRWGKDRTILHKVCDLPFAFFSDPELMPFLAGTLVAACYGCEQNKGVIQQELSMDMLLSLLASCRNSLPVSSVSVSDNVMASESVESNQAENQQRSQRLNPRSSRVQSQKVSSANNRTVKTRSQRENKMLKVSEEVDLKPIQSATPTSASSTLYSRLPVSFIQKAEQFFSTEIPLL